MALSPEQSAWLRQMETRNQRMQAQMQSLMKRYNQLSAQLEDSSIEQKRLKAAVKKAAERIRYVEDIQGKRVPYFMQFGIEIPGPTTPGVQVAGQRLSDTQPVSQDGPFVCTQYMSAFLMKTYSIGPYTTEGGGRENDPPAGTEVITPLSGRWRPVASTADPFAGAYIGYSMGPLTIAGAQTAQTFKPGTVDFLFEVSDEGTDRLRQNSIPIPSRYLFSEFDRPLYLPVADFFERGSTIQFSATLTRELGFAEVNYALLANGFTEGNQIPPPDPTDTQNPESGRCPVSIGGTLYFTMLGYKILQAQSPAV
jgi:hypothetical protein